MNIYGYIINIYKTHNIRAFPIDVFSLAIKMGYNLHRFSSLQPETLKKIKRISTSACLLDRTIYFNDTQPLERVRFSISHEIGHDILETEDEDLADAFAGELLAPSPIIRTRGIATAEQLAEEFELSISAANRALFRGKKWVGFRLPKDDPSWQIVRWFNGEKEKPEKVIIPEDESPQRLPPLLSKEEKEKLSPEQQKRIASIRRKRRKIAKQLPEAEEYTDLISDLGISFDVLDYQRFGD